MRFSPIRSKVVLNLLSAALRSLNLINTYGSFMFKEHVDLKTASTDCYYDIILFFFLLIEPFLSVTILASQLAS